ncbi:hypothetical protein H1C71_036095 [Ictidomys tridecemlineatus]|nr:hypothetical protein H1C71_036095 [Ictidomys tridecemlineatus]
MECDPQSLVTRGLVPFSLCFPLPLRLSLSPSLSLSISDHLCLSPSFSNSLSPIPHPLPLCLWVPSHLYSGHSLAFFLPISLSVFPVSLLLSLFLPLCLSVSPSLLPHPQGGSSRSVLTRALQGLDSSPPMCPGHILELIVFYSKLIDPTFTSKWPSKW